MFNKVRAVAVLALLACGGCAMPMTEGDASQPLPAAILDYGPPNDVYDIDSGTRAFIWTMRHGNTTPGNTMTSGAPGTSGAGYVAASLISTNRSGFYNARTNLAAPGTCDWSCNYVLLAHPNDSGIDGPAGWTVVGFSKPELICE